MVMMMMAQMEPVTCRVHQGEASCWVEVDGSEERIPRCYKVEGACVLTCPLLTRE
jgi:hypothetical protein